MVYGGEVSTGVLAASVAVDDIDMVVSDPDMLIVVLLVARDKLTM